MPRITVLLLCLAACGDEKSDELNCSPDYMEATGAYCLMVWDCDGKAYAINCPDRSTATYTCDCQIDGATVASFDTSSYCSDADPHATMNTECGWDMKISGFH